MEFTKEPLEKIEFTTHILERYVERTMGKSEIEARQFLAQNSEQVKEKILKLYEYSELLWYGKIKEHDFTYFTINRDGWVIVIDKNKIKLITIYQVDLGLGVDFNKQYISEIKKCIEKDMADIEDEKTNYEELIKANNEAIENFKEKNKILQSELEYNNNEIKFLEQEKNLGLSKVTLKEKQLHKKIEKFIGAKIF